MEKTGTNSNYPRTRIQTDVRMHEREKYRYRFLERLNCTRSDDERKVKDGRGGEENGEEKYRMMASGRKGEFEPLSSFSNSAPMKTGTKCFDIYRLPLLPGRFADASEAVGGKKRRRREGRLVAAGVMGYIFWRKANDNGRGTQRLDVGTHTSEPYDSISPFPSPHF